MTKHLLRLVMLTLFAALGAARSDARGEPLLSLSSSGGSQGGTMALELRLAEGTGAYAGFNSTLALPLEFPVLGVSSGELVSSNRFTFSYNQTTNTLSIVAYSNTNTFTGSGVLARIQLAIPITAPVGRRTVGFKDDALSLVKSHGLSNRDGSLSLPHQVTSGFLEVIAGNADSDGDGFSDRVEIGFGTDPNDPASAPRPALARSSDGRLSIIFPSSNSAEFRYRVRYADQLVSPVNLESWPVLVDRIVGSGGPIRVDDTGPIVGQRFYHVTVEVP